MDYVDQWLIKYFGTGGLAYHMLCECAFSISNQNYQWSDEDFRAMETAYQHATFYEWTGNE